MKFCPCLLMPAPNAAGIFYVFPGEEGGPKPQTGGDGRCRFKEGI